MKFLRIFIFTFITTLIAPTQVFSNSLCNDICEPDDICDPSVVCIWEGKCPSDCKDTTPSPVPTCTPRPSCLDEQPRCLMPEPIEGWCDDVVSPPEVSPEIIVCQAGGGTWNEFLPNGCMDTCPQYEKPGEVACTMAITAGCDCGPTMCWSGTSCVSNPMPAQTKKHTLREWVRTNITRILQRLALD